jgi:outer membrane receptor for ferric coprogen and ferric-rhodotorulic acid
MASYDITRDLTLTVNGNNITDEKYLNSLYWSQAYYGAGSNYTASISYRF